MENVYVVWQADHSSYDDRCLDCGSYDTGKSIIKILGSKQEAEEYIKELYEQPLDNHSDENDSYDCYVNYEYSITQHRFG